jgi:hypothetical protein
MASRRILKIEISKQARESLEGLYEKFGITKVAAMTRLVEFVCRQSELTQLAIMGWDIGGSTKSDEITTAVLNQVLADSSN